MPEPKKLAVLLMDAPYESARTATAFRLLDAATRRGHDVTVFCYEGAVGLSFARQAQHANPVHGRDLAQEDHPNPKDWIGALMRQAERSGGRLAWINCGLCVDERGVAETVPGVGRGSPVDFWKATETADNTLVIPTKG
jgi:tRNA 2-thiouridine synthesizing protein D